MISRGNRRNVRKTVENNLTEDSDQYDCSDENDYFEGSIKHIVKIGKVKAVSRQSDSFQQFFSHSFYFPSKSYLFYFVDHPVCILFYTLRQNGSFPHTIYSLSHMLGILFLMEERILEQCIQSVDNKELIRKAISKGWELDKFIEEVAQIEAQIFR
jgi:hypothetical protein